MSNRSLAIVAVVLAVLALETAPAAAGWQQPVKLSELGGTTSRYPAVAAARDGAFLGAWKRALPDPATTSVIEARWIDAGGAVGPLLTLTESPGTVENPRAAVAPDGSAIVLWIRVVGPQQIAVEGRRVGRDGSLGPLLTISEPGDQALLASVAIAGSGTATVGWIREVVDSAVLKARTISAAGELGDAHTLTDVNDGITDEVAVSIGPDGAPLVAYVQFGTVKAQRLSASGEPLPGIEVLSQSGDTSAYLDAGADTQGVSRVSWGRTDPSPFTVSSRTVDGDDVLGPTLITSPPGVRATGPRMAVNGAGAAGLAWQVTPPNPDPESVGGRSVGADGKLGAALSLSAPSGPGGMNQRVGIDARGITTAVWQRNLGGTGIVEARRFARGGARGRARELSRPAEVLPTPAVAVAPDGLAFAIWVQQTPKGERVRIRGARFVPAAGRGPLPAAPARIRCGGRAATIVGSSRADVITGTPRADVIVGGAGGDRIAGRGGRDRICGLGGDDEIAGNRGADRLAGGGGADRLLGGRAADRLLGDGGDDRCAGGPGRTRKARC